MANSLSPNMKDTLREMGEYDHPVCAAQVLSAQQTMDALVRRGLCEEVGMNDWGVPQRTYRLTEKGKKKYKKIAV